MTVVKRNQIIVLALAIMIVAAGYLNFSYKGSEPFAEEITGTTGEKLGEATLVEGQENLDIGYAEPASSILTDEVQSSAGNKTVENQSVQTTGDTNQYFSETRTEKERVREQEVALHEKIIGNNSASKEARTKAQAELSAISQKWEKEMIIERLIKAKGFNDAVVFINDGSVNVVVLNGAKLSTAQVAQIQDIVTRETKVPLDKIKIVEK